MHGDSLDPEIEGIHFPIIQIIWNVINHLIKYSNGQIRTNPTAAASFDCDNLRTAHRCEQCSFGFSLLLLYRILSVSRNTFLN